MGDRATIYLEMPSNDGSRSGIYLYTHYSGYRWPEELREALEFGRSRWTDDQYLARIVTSRVFQDLVDDEVGGGLSLMIGDNEYPIIVADLINQQVSFADAGSERNPDQRHGHRSFNDYVEQERAGYPEEVNR